VACCFSFLREGGGFQRNIFTPFGEVLSRIQSKVHEKENTVGGKEGDGIAYGEEDEDIHEDLEDNGDAD